MWSIIVSFLFGIFGIKPSAQTKLDKVQNATDKELNRELRSHLPNNKEVDDYWSSHRD